MIMFGVAHAKAAAHVDDLGFEIIARLTVGGEARKRFAAGNLRVWIEQLRADMAMKTDEWKIKFLRTYERFFGGAIPDVETELAVFLAGSDAFMGDGIDAGSESKKKFRARFG